MKTEKEIKNLITELISSHSHVLGRPLALVESNAQMALLQVQVTNALSALFWVLERERPKFMCDHPAGEKIGEETNDKNTIICDLDFLNGEKIGENTNDKNS